ncbi:hypothetical protein HMPREF0636_1386 [Porphyromonas catoniae ATCC 51270]|uniref:Uncharacterized protein n=1 Tax=Porphyromonas catoniae ATCC 51270 TaxID=887901 RepID=Z4X058_9PORP|nr:hypothetical protein HMPREF0636_1386 [Porphyromonas catoniae ATCC 51270]
MQGWHRNPCKGILGNACMGSLSTPCMGLNKHLGEILG